MLDLLREKIASVVKDKNLSGNVILTGGGAALSGVIEVACQVFGTRAVRLGEPWDYGGLKNEYRKAEYATAVGLIVSNLDKKRGSEEQNGEKNARKKKGVFSAIGGWFKEFF